MAEEGEGDIQSSIQKSRLPGGPLVQRPIVDERGREYPLFRGSKTIEAPDGTVTVLDNDPDVAWSKQYWNEQAQELPGDQLRALQERMKGTITNAYEEGTLTVPVEASRTPEGKINLGEKSKGELSAYRILAQRQGGSVGGFKYNEAEGTVTATVTKPEDDPIQR
jgi:hypothetical protein